MEVVSYDGFRDRSCYKEVVSVVVRVRVRIVGRLGYFLGEVE